jgi:hypothetical protein
LWLYRTTKLSTNLFSFISSILSFVFPSFHLFCCIQLPFLYWWHSVAFFSIPSSSAWISLICSWFKSSSTLRYPDFLIYLFSIPWLIALLRLCLLSFLSCDFYFFFVLKVLFPFKCFLLSLLVLLPFCIALLSFLNFSIKMHLSFCV